MLFLAIGGYKLCRYWLETSQGKQMYTGLQEYVSFPTRDPVPTPEPSGIGSEDQAELPAQQTDQFIWPKVDFDSLRQINPDIVG